MRALLERFRARLGALQVACALLAIHGVMLAWASTLHSPCIDEYAHVPAGLSHWRFGRFELYRANPPLVRMVAALPVLLAGPAENWRRYNDKPRAEFGVGGDFLRANAAESVRYFVLARWACIPLALLGGYVCFRWASDLFGPSAGLLATVLWCFCPNMLGYGHLALPDMGATALGIAASYAFWLWLRAATWARASLAGALLGLAELTKTTWLILFALWPLLWLLYRLPGWRAMPWRKRLLQLGQLALLLTLGVFLVNACYGFSGSWAKLGSYTFTSRALGGDDRPLTEEAWTTPGNRFVGTWLESLPVPFPKDYVLGVDLVKAEFERKMRSYLRGEWRVGGWWYYYIYALAVKVPLGTWAVVGTALGLTLVRAVGASLRDELCLMLPPLSVLTLVSSQTGFNHHVRYVLPVLPFVFVWASRVAAYPVRLGRWVRLGTVCAVAWSVVGSIVIYPHSLSYFNELAGGPRGGHRHLVDSNIDLGQDLLFLKAWVEAHPEARPLRVAYRGPLLPALLGIEADEMPADAGPDEIRNHPGGWYAVSVQLVCEEYPYLLRWEPVATVGYSIYIYRLPDADPIEFPRTAKASGRERSLQDGLDSRSTPGRE
jgi:hypothetical protein